MNPVPRGSLILMTWMALAVGAAIRILLVLQPACIDRNGVQFVEFARRLNENPREAMRITTRQPGYAFLLLWTHKLVGPTLGGDTPEAWQRSGELLALASGIAVCIGVVLLTRRLFDERVALVAAVLVALWPQGAHLSAGVLSDMPHLAIFLFAALVALGAVERQSPWRIAVAGALAGLAYLFKQEAACLIPAAIWCWWRCSVPGRLRYVGPLAFIAAFAVCVAPHSLATGHLIPNKGPLDVWKLFSDAGSRSFRASGILAYVVSWWEAPGRFFVDWLRSGRYVIGLLFFAGVFLPFAPNADRRGRSLIVSTLAVYVVLVQIRATIYGELSERYAAVAAALTLPWAAAGWLAIIEELPPMLVNASRHLRAPLGFLVVMVPVTPLILYATRPVYDGKDHYREAGAALRQMAAPGDLVLVHEHLEQVMFYADRTHPAKTWIKSRRADSGRRIERLLGKKPAWYVDAEGSRRGEIDEAAHFAWIASQPDRLRLVNSMGPVGRRVFIYQVVEPKGS
ncbi:MAG TPA: glycosyltransferase family 39 protein [Phycisphaerae bacterium]|nr:glycosyltransferase family 39 protein [Phycisphaerae bacterium]